MQTFAADQEQAIEIANAALSTFPMRFDMAWRKVIGMKLGITRMSDEDMALAQDLFDRMASAGADFTLTFRRLTDGEDLEPEMFGEWQARWRVRMDNPELMRIANPRFIPRNHRIEQAIAAAVDNEDYSLFETLVKVLARPFDAQPDFAGYADPPAPEEVVCRTFCGT